MNSGYRNNRERKLIKERGYDMAGMDFIKGLGNTISSASRDGLSKAKEMRDSAKISFDIRERENAIRRMYRDLGKAYYQDHKDDISSEYRDRITAISAAFEEIGELKASLDEVRGIRRCPACGKIISPEAKFCAECGEKCEEEVVECEVVEDDEEDTVGSATAEDMEDTAGSAAGDTEDTAGSAAAGDTEDAAGSVTADTEDAAGGATAEDAAGNAGGGCGTAADGVSTDTENREETDSADTAE